MTEADTLERSKTSKLVNDGQFYLGQDAEKDAIDGALPISRQKENNLKTQQLDFTFALRGLAINKIIDCVSPLIALILRISSLTNYDEVDDLHKRCKSEIDALSLELHKLGYDRVTCIAFSYCLCSFIDEAVLTTPWGESSGWAQQSLLAIYHHETWGGEKFFVVARRLSDEPHRYIDILEFLYLCMVLGYEGKYRPEHNGKLNLEAFMQEIHDIIRKERGFPEDIRTFNDQNIIAKEHIVKWQTPIMVIIISALVFALILYLSYFFYTENYTNGVINELSNVLNGKSS